MADLSLHQLRKSNSLRAEEWGNTSPGIGFRMLELSGEVGEACEVVKKMERVRLQLAGGGGSIEHLADELADVQIALDLAAMEAGIDLADAVRCKFNKTSQKHGMSTKIHFEGSDDD